MTILYHVVERGYVFVERLGRVDARHFNLLLGIVQADKVFTSGGDHLGLAGKGVALFPAGLGPDGPA